MSLTSETEILFKIKADDLITSECITKQQSVRVRLKQSPGKTLYINTSEKGKYSVKRKHNHHCLHLARV